MNNRSVPVSTLIPHLVYGNLTEASAWLQRVCGFAEHYRYGDPVGGIQIYLGGAFLMLASVREGRESPATLGSRTQMLTIFVTDVDAHYARAKKAGATIWEELHETGYGEKQYGLEDLEGHRWLFSHHVRDMDPAEWGAAISSPTPIRTD